MLLVEFCHLPHLETYLAIVHNILDERRERVISRIKDKGTEVISL